MSELKTLPTDASVEEFLAAVRHAGRRADGIELNALLRDRTGYLTDRYSERVESAEEVSKRVNQRSI